MKQLPRLRISLNNPHRLATADGEPFFLLGDTAWELLHRLTRPEIDPYLSNRAAKGFNVICTVALAEFDGLRTPNAEGQLPLTSDDPSKPNEAYFDLLDYVLEQASNLGLYIGLLPTWGDKLTAPWGEGPRIFNIGDTQAIETYGRWLGERYRSATNILWILGGDRPAKLAGISSDWGHPSDAGFTSETDWTPLWAALASGITEGTDGTALFSYHPQGGSYSSSQCIHSERWLGINMIQSGHGGGHDAPIWDWIARDYALVPFKPTLDGEPNYEDHPVNPWPTYDPQNGYFDDYDVRKQCYRSVFAGGCGVVYGHHSVWQFWDGKREGINYTKFVWQEAIDRPGASHVGHLRALMDRYSQFDLVPDNSIVSSDIGLGGLRIGAMKDRAGHLALIYIPDAGREIELAPAFAEKDPIASRWFDPRSGTFSDIEMSGARASSGSYMSPNRNPNSEPDWVLVLEY